MRGVLALSEPGFTGLKERKDAHCRNYLTAMEILRTAMTPESIVVNFVSKATANRAIDYLIIIFFSYFYYALMA